MGGGASVDGCVVCIVFISPVSTVPQTFLAVIPDDDYIWLDPRQIRFCLTEGYEDDAWRKHRESVIAKYAKGTASSPNESDQGPTARYTFLALELGHMSFTPPSQKERGRCVTDSTFLVTLAYLPELDPRFRIKLRANISEIIAEWKKYRAEVILRPLELAPARHIYCDSNPDEPRQGSILLLDQWLEEGIDIEHVRLFYGATDEDQTSAEAMQLHYDRAIRRQSIMNKVENKVVVKGNRSEDPVQLQLDDSAEVLCSSELFTLLYYIWMKLEALGVRYRDPPERIAQVGTGKWMVEELPLREAEPTEMIGVSTGPNAEELYWVEKDNRRVFVERCEAIENDEWAAEALI